MWYDDLPLTPSDKRRSCFTITDSFQHHVREATSRILPVVGTMIPLPSVVVSFGLFRVFMPELDVRFNSGFCLFKGANWVADRHHEWSNFRLVNSLAMCTPADRAQRADCLQGSVRLPGHQNAPTEPYVQLSPHTALRVRNIKETYKDFTGSAVSSFNSFEFDIEGSLLQSVRNAIRNVFPLLDWLWCLFPSLSGEETIVGVEPNSGPG